MSGSTQLGAKGDFVTSPEISQMFGEVTRRTDPALSICRNNAMENILPTGIMCLARRSHIGAAWRHCPGDAQLVAVWLANQWETAGRPSAVRLVEMGPGSGALTSDIIRVRR